MIVAGSLLALQLLTARPVPIGTRLQVRLTTTSGSYASRAGDPIGAELIVPVTDSDGVELPAGSKLSGRLSSVQRVGFGLVHETAALDFDFDRITLPDGTSVPVSTRVQAVDTGRERVSKDGSIHGQRKTASLAYRFGTVIRTAVAFELHSAIAVWAMRMVLVQLPEPEIYYPKGVELTLRVTQPFLAPKQEDTGETVAALSDGERDAMKPLIETLPIRSQDPKHDRPADVVNVMLVGSREEVTEAFKSAGWTAAERKTLVTDVKQIRAVADGSGYSSAPMSKLLLNGALPEFTLQKGFNDPAKRHHIRIWKQADTVDGQDVWLGAATRDIDFAYMRPGHAMTHKIESNVDLEREKVINDLEYTGCTSVVDSFERANTPVYTQNATGDTILTDARLALLKLHSCDALQARGSKINIGDFSAEDNHPLPKHGNGWQRFARREILTFRDEMLRENAYFRTYEGLRWSVIQLHEMRERHLARITPKVSPEVELARHPNRGGRILSDMLR